MDAPIFSFIRLRDGSCALGAYIQTVGDMNSTGITGGTEIAHGRGPPLCQTQCQSLQTLLDLFSQQGSEE